MPNNKGSRGAHGKQGPPGPRGPRGKQGDIGGKGERGEQGLTGAAITATDRIELLALVEGQIEAVYHELDSQMKRLAGIQEQVDELRANIARLTGHSK